MIPTTLPVLAAPPTTAALPAVSPISPILDVSSVEPVSSGMSQRRTQAEPVRNWFALGGFVAALCGLLILPLPFGVLSLAAGGYALWITTTTPRLPGKELAILSLLIGLFNVGFWVAWTISHLDVRTRLRAVASVT